MHHERRNAENARYERQNRECADFCRNVVALRADRHFQDAEKHENKHRNGCDNHRKFSHEIKVFHGATQRRVVIVADDKYILGICIVLLTFADDVVRHLFWQQFTEFSVAEVHKQKHASARKEKDE